MRLALHKHSVRYTIDGIHPNALGMKKLARFIIQKALELPRGATGY